MPKPDSGLRSPLNLFSLVVGVVTALMGLMVIAGWVWDVPSLKSILPGFATMKANTALGITFLGIGLSLNRLGITARRMSKVFAALAVAIGIITLAEDLLAWEAGIDQLLFMDTETLPAENPGRPSHATAFNLMILGIGLLGADSRAFRCLATLMAVMASLVSWIALNGYVFGAQELYGVGLYSSIALHTAALFFLFSIGLMATQPHCPPTRIVLSKSTGGTLSRGLLPFAVIAPPVLGWLFRHVQTLGAYHDEFSWALYSVASSVGSVGLIIFLAHRVVTIDAERARATELSRHDPLTGLANRRAFDEFFLESFRLATRHSRPLALLMLDIDHFKHYNDTFGHPAGDQALRIIAGLLNKHARETDLVARIGGEEFAIVLPETDLTGALMLAERIRAEVEQSAAFLCPMTVSIGTVGLTEKITNTVVFMQECDAALYRAKEQGRNRVAWLENRQEGFKPGINF